MCGCRVKLLLWVRIASLSDLFSIFCVLILPFSLQELLGSIGPVEFPAGKAQISEVSKCTGDVSATIFLGSNRVVSWL